MTTLRTQMSLLLIVVALTVPASIVAQTQANMTEDACADLKKADAQLNHVYTQVLKRRGSDPQFREKFITAERAWITFRNAELKAVFPRDTSAYSSSLPMCQCAERARLTRDRTKQLQEWVKSREGDVCAGSRS